MFAGICAAPAAMAGPFHSPRGEPSAADPYLQPVAVFGPDNRVALPRAQKSLKNRIGILFETRSRSVCTAFCVDQAVIATASHCLFRTEREAAPRLNGFVFQLNGPEARGISSIAGASTGFGAQHVIAGSTRLAITPPIAATRDWALVKLSKPICTAGGLPVVEHGPEALNALADAGLIYQVAYHRDLPKLELAHGGPCWMRGRENAQERAAIERDFEDTRDLLLHTCDTGGASSGSPLLVDGPAGPEVVGINVGTYVRSKVLMQNGDVMHRFKSDSISNTAVGAGAFAAPLSAFLRADILDTKRSVQALQDRLRAHGYYRGPRDGRYGPALKAAIESYERAEKRPAIGLASADLLRRLTVGRPGGFHAIETGSIDRSVGRSTKK